MFYFCFIFIASIPSVPMDEQHSVIKPFVQTGLKKHRACTAEPLSCTLCYFVHSTAFGPVNKPQCRPQASMHSAGVSEYVSVLTYRFYTGRCTWILSLSRPVSTIAYNTYVLLCELLDMYNAIHNDVKSNARTQSLRKRGKIQKKKKIIIKLKASAFLTQTMHSHFAVP